LVMQAANKKQTCKKPFFCLSKDIEKFRGT
jgi:hypothetical protein